MTRLGVGMFVRQRTTILSGVLDDLGRLYEDLDRRLDDAGWVTNRFVEILNQLDESEGKGVAKIESDERTQRQTALAASEAGLELGPLGAQVGAGPGQGDVGPLARLDQTALGAQHAELLPAGRPTGLPGTADGLTRCGVSFGHYYLEACSRRGRMDRFFERLAFTPTRNPVRWPLRAVARWRVARHAYGLPIERRVIEWLRPPRELS